MSGGAYETGGMSMLSESLPCPATSMFTWRPAPTPGSVTHCSSWCAAVMLQLATTSFRTWRVPPPETAGTV